MWYKKAQQTELGLEEDTPKQPPQRLKSDPESINHVATVLAVMLMDEKIDGAIIQKGLRQLKELKDEGRITDKMGPLVVNKFDVSLNNPYSIWRISSP